MKAVVDTNVIAYYLLGNAELATEVRRFWRDVRDAERECIPIVTFDQRLLNRWLDIACRPADASAH